MQYISHAYHQNSVEGLKNVDEALTCVGISHEDRLQIYKTLAAILHLGNIVFKENSLSEKCEISESSRVHLEHAARLLDIDEQMLERILLTRIIDLNGSDQIV